MIKRNPRYTVTVYYWIGRYSFQVDTLGSYALYRATTSNLWYYLFGKRAEVWDRVQEYRFTIHAWE